MRICRGFTIAACLCTAWLAAAAEAPSLEIGAAALPDAVPVGLRDALESRSFTLVSSGQPRLRLWLRQSLPGDSGDPESGELNYATLPQGSLIGVMQVLKPHIDYRDQMVPPGVFALRYLQQPVNGEHVGVTYFRDFLVLNPLRSNTSSETRSFQSTLAAALQLNTHPYVWGLWPAREAVVDPLPGLAPVDEDKYVLVVDLPRQDGSTLRLAIVLVGSQPPDGYR